MQRRTFLHAGLVSVLTAKAFADPLRTPRILVRSSWQVVNIGDIAHTPGVLALLESHFPSAEVILWASESLTDEVAAMLRRRFPGLRIVKGHIKADKTASTPELEDAVRWADFLLHGSGPSFVAHKDVAAFVERTKKPFGVAGITYKGGSDRMRALLGRAKFVFFRDSVSLSKAKEDEIAAAVMEFGPDGAFACDLRNDDKAERFLRENGLEKGRYLCCIPRLRHTPYWRIHSRAMRQRDHVKQTRNREMEEHDHAPLRAAIEAIVRKTGMKVLVCPEDMSQMAVGKRMLVGKLPEDVRKNVVWRRDFWLPDEALSVYVRSAGLFGLEMHSPIMCVGNGVPAVVCRFAEQTSKGFMWRDIGLNDWLFDVDDSESMKALTPTVLDIVNDPVSAGKKVDTARRFVGERQKHMMEVLAEAVG